MKFCTRAVHPGVSLDPTTGSIVPPIYQTATYALEGIGKFKGFDYTRSSGPTNVILEACLASLESGKYGVSYSSGMAAVDAILRLLSAGDHIISSEDVYGGTSRLFDEVLTRFGLSFSYVDTTQPQQISEAIRKNTKLIWVETPSNPLLKITDVGAVKRIAKEHGILLAVDSTLATPFILRPLELGADLVLHSTSKYLSGHNQLIGGTVITNDQELYGQLKFLQKNMGNPASPFDAWLTLLGVKTLPLRMQKICQNAAFIASLLQNHHSVSRVIYPGLSSHPQHTTAKCQMSDFGGLISFELHGGLQAAKTLVGNIHICSFAESFGSVETMLTHPASMTNADMPREVRLQRGLTDGLVRLSVGIEDVEDIAEDLKQALKKT